MFLTPTAETTPNDPTIKYEKVREESSSDARRYAEKSGTVLEEEELALRRVLGVVDKRRFWIVENGGVAVGDCDGVF